MKQSYFFKILFVFLSWSVFISASAQERTVTGKVTDAESGESLPGVTVIIQGTQQGAITMPDGTYSLQAAADDVLVFSFLGYVTEEIPVGNQSVINVTLEDQVMGLDEVVVIGYGQVKKEDATGSVTAIQADEINRGAPVTPEELLTGKTAGVNITSAGGMPGSGSTIRIRGGSSLSASNDPLIVIDGVPVDNEEISGMGNPLSTINPNDIETFTVLKDASATAIYGSRASNGVIIITTKKGTRGAPLRLSYNGYATVNTIDKTVNVLSADRFREIVNEKAPGGVSALGNANTDWQDEIFRTSFTGL